MGDQPVSLLVAESVLAALSLAIGAVLVAGWLMGRIHRARGLREPPPGRGDVPGHAHYPASLSR